MGQSPYRPYRTRSTSSTSFFDFIYWAVLERREEERRDEAWRRKWREEILAEWRESGWRTERYTEEKLTEELEEERKKRATKDRAEKEATWRRNGWWFDENFPHREGGGRSHDMEKTQNTHRYSSTREVSSVGNGEDARKAQRATKHSTQAREMRCTGDSTKGGGGGVGQRRLGIVGMSFGPKRVTMSWRNEAS